MGRSIHIMTNGLVYLGFALMVQPSAAADFTFDYSETHHSKILQKIENSQRPDRDEVQVLLAELSDYGGAAVQAAGQLLAYIDADVLSLLLFRLHEEMLSEQPNRDLIVAILRAFQLTANKNYVVFLRELRSLLRDRSLPIGKIEKRQFIIGEFDKALRAAQARAVIEPQTSIGLGGLKTVQQEVELFRDYLEKVAKDPNAEAGRKIHAKIPAVPEEYLLAVTSGVLTDDARLRRQEGNSFSFFGRQEEADEVLDVIIRTRAKSAILAGASGVGKTTIGHILAERIVDQKFPKTDVYLAELENAEVLSTTPARISQMALSNEATAQAAAMELFFDSVRAVEKNYFKKTGRRKPILVLLDDFHTLDPPQMNALKKILEDQQNPVRVIGAANIEKLKIKLKSSPGLEKLLKLVSVREFSRDVTFQLLKETSAPYFESRYKVKFDENAIQTIITVASYLHPDLARPEAPYALMEDVAIKSHRENGGHEGQPITDDFVYAYAKKITGLPTNPHNPREFDSYMQNLRTRLLARVSGQEGMTEALLKLWAQVLTGDPRVAKSILFSGPTGVGKTLLGATFAEEAFGDRGRMIEIDGPSMQDGGDTLEPVFGGPRASETGRLMDWFDDPSKGKYGGVIFINEAEKMHPDVWFRLMQLMSEGSIAGGDGGNRHACRHLIIFTSNKGTREIFPDAVIRWSRAEIDARIRQLSESDIKNYFLRTDLSAKGQVIPREVVARIDMAVVARPVTTETAPAIGEIEVDRLVQKLGDLYHLRIDVDTRLKHYLALTGLDILLGARPIHDQVEAYISAAVNEARIKWDMPRDSHVALKLIEFAPGVPPEIEVSFNQKKFNIKAPQKRAENPFLDTAVIAMMDKISDVMHDHMSEQPEIVDEIATAIKAKYGDAARKRPISFTLAGTTGLGKSEMGRAITKAVYFSTERLEIIPLGEIHNDRQLEIVFGAVGSKAVGLFEKALLNNPQGGVIMFDEFSNMGGDDLEIKDALIKKFYTILEEGFWISPRDGRVWDLRNFIFLFTGNDLESELQGISSDEQRIAIWSKIKNRERVQALLRKRGVPEAFLGRQDVVAVMKPPGASGKSRITSNIFREWKTRFENQHQGVTIKEDENFIKALADGSFSHDRGARSVRNVIENYISSLASESLRKFGYDPVKLQGVQLKLSLTDTLPQTIYVDGSIKPRRVMISAQLFKNGEHLHTTEIDATRAMARIAVITKKEALLAAYREAGRIVVNQADHTQLEPAYVTVRGSYVQEIRTVGYSLYEELEGANQALNRSQIVARLAALWAGQLAQKKAGYEPDSQWAMNLAEMRRLAMGYLLSGGLIEGLEAVTLNEKGLPQFTGEQRRLFDAEIKKIFSDSQRLATERLSRKWAQVEKLVEVLLLKGELNGSEISPLLEENPCLAPFSSGPKSG